MKMKDCLLTRQQMKERDIRRIEEMKAAGERIDKNIIDSLVASASANSEYSTHHKSCALRHNGIACTCP